MTYTPAASPSSRKRASSRFALVCRALSGQVRMSVRRQLTYRTDVAMAVVTLCIQVYLLRVVWTTVYGGRTQVASIAHDQAIAYALLAACLQTALMPWTFSSLAERVRGGQVGVDMTRPIGLIAQVLAQSAYLSL